MIVSSFHRRAPIPRFLGVAAAPLAVLSTAPRLHAQSAASVEPDAAQAARPTCDADSGGITLPPGFCAVAVADQEWASRGTSWSRPMATSTGRPAACYQLIAPEGRR